MNASSTTPQGLFYMQKINMGGGVGQGGLETFLAVRTSSDKCKTTASVPAVSGAKIYAFETCKRNHQVQLGGGVYLGQGGWVG